MRNWAEATERRRMRRARRFLPGLGLIIVPIALVTPAPSSGQTTTTTTTTTTVAPTTSTLATTTTTTTLLSTPATIPPTIPTATLSGASGQVVGELGSFAWPQADGTMVARIVDFVIEGPNPAQTLTVTQGETLALNFQPAPPVATLTVGVWPGGPNNPSLAVPAANPSRFVMTLAPGTHVISVEATFQGLPNARASYHFKVRVLAPEGRPLALTG